MLKLNMPLIFQGQNRPVIQLHSVGRNVSKAVLATDKSNFYYLFDRVGEPIFIPKGDEGNKRQFIIPQDYFVCTFI